MLNDDTRRRSTHDTDMRLRINSDLLGRVEAAAQREGVSLSEYTRTALRREMAQVSL